MEENVSGCFFLNTVYYSALATLVLKTHTEAQLNDDATWRCVVLATVMVF